MRIFLSIIYIISLVSGVIVFYVYSLPVLTTNYGSLPVISILTVVFLLLFGIYGLIGIRLCKTICNQNNMPNSEIEVSYYIRKKGLLGKLFLFPFIHIKSRYSLVIAFFGSLVWIVILMVIYFGIVVKVL
ncbi:MAG: hypothetical protein K8S00_00450 [Bacteroidales bacterium]|nr:hypothetical protein [Bacteroidales bacterium]